MIQLFLSESHFSSPGPDGDESHQQQVSLLKKLESAIWTLIMSCGGRSEARLWLSNTLASICSISPRQQRELFGKLLRSKPQKRMLAAQILQIIFEKQPRKAGNILSKKSHLLEDFFKGHPRRILQWFSNFSAGNKLGHTKGAKALSQFAFVNRDICWEELEWKGKHGQSPAMVATKPHYFLDLDVQQTVENIIENVPEFWSSPEFADSLEDGEILVIDTKFFLDLFIDLMFNKDEKEVWDVIDQFIMDEPFKSLCHHLLIALGEQDLCIFLESLRNILSTRISQVDYSIPSYWLEIVLSRCTGSVSIDQLLLLNAVVNQGRQLLRLVREEENKEEKDKIKNTVDQIYIFSSHSSLRPLMEECLEAKTIEAVKWLGVQSWVLQYRLSEECCTPQSWESLFRDNRISFRKSCNYELLGHDGFSDECDSDLDDRISLKVKRKKKEKRRKKRSKKLDEDELLDLDMSENKTSLESGTVTWMLSTDGYSTSWSSVDLPEHLSKHSFSTWMKWLLTRWEK